MITEKNKPRVGLKPVTSWKKTWRGLIGEFQDLEKIVPALLDVFST